MGTRGTGRAARPGARGRRAGPGLGGPPEAAALRGPAPAALPQPGAGRGSPKRSCPPPLSPTCPARLPSGVPRRQPSSRGRKGPGPAAGAPALCDGRGAAGRRPSKVKPRPRLCDTRSAPCGSAGLSVTAGTAVITPSPRAVTWMASLGAGALPRPALSRYSGEHHQAFTVPPSN